MAERPEWISRDKLGDYWPSLGGNMAEILACRGEGPAYQIGAGKKAWYRAETVEAWLLEEEARQAEGRKSSLKIARQKDVALFGVRRPRQRATKMDRYLARRA